MIIGDLVNLKIQKDKTDKLIIWDFRNDKKEVLLVRESTHNSVGWFSVEELD